MSDLSKARCILIGLTVISYILVFSLVPVVGLKVDYNSFMGSVLFFGACAAVAAVLATWIDSPRLFSIIENYLCGILLIAPIVISTYLAVKLNMPWADDRLMSMDEGLGINWLAILRFVDSQKYLARALNISYSCFGIQLLSIPIILTVLNYVVRSYQMVIIYSTACFISSVISIWYPALGTYSVHGVDPSSLNNVNGTLGIVFLHELTGVKLDPEFIFTASRVQGIMTFPSVHAAVSVICAWAVWPLKRLRYPVLGLNILMATSAAIVSNHYFVDVIAGIGVASFSIAMVLYAFKPKASDIKSTCLPGLANISA